MKHQIHARIPKRQHFVPYRWRYNVVEWATKLNNKWFSDEPVHGIYLSLYILAFTWTINEKFRNLIWFFIWWIVHYRLSSVIQLAFSQVITDATNIYCRPKANFEWLLLNHVSCLEWWSYSRILQYNPQNLIYFVFSAEGSRLLWANACRDKCF